MPNKLLYKETSSPFSHLTKLLSCIAQISILPYPSIEGLEKKMKQQMVIKVQMHSDKCRSKAMKLAASAYGVDSIKLDGEDKNQLVVVGEGVDPVNLTWILRKKIGYSDLVKVEEMKKEEGEEKSEETKVEVNYPWCGYPQTRPVLLYDEPYESSRGGCSIL